MVGKSKIIYQGHHPAREWLPEYTIKLRKWIHLYVRRLEQLSPTKENIEELRNVVDAVTWIYLLKQAERVGIDNECREEKVVMKNAKAKVGRKSKSTHKIQTA